MRAVEGYRASQGTMAAMFPLFKLLLGGIATNISEITFVPANSRLDVVVLIPEVGVNAIDDRSHHHVLKVTLKRGADHYLDMTGAQYGYDQVAGPWDSAFLHRIQNLDGLVIEPHGAAFIKFITGGIQDMPRGLSERAIEMAICPMLYLMASEGRKKRQRERDVSVKRLLGMREKEYGREEEGFLNACKAEALKAFDGQVLLKRPLFERWDGDWLLEKDGTMTWISSEFGEEVD